MTDPSEATTPGDLPEASEGDAAVRPRRHLRRTRALFAPVGRALDKVPHPPLRSKRGLLLLFLLVAGFGSIVTFGGVTAVKYTETASFCGRCHTMDPELKAYAMSPHKEVTCAECHVEPGAAGWIKAKAKGTKQLIQVMTGEFPTP
ncbi:MAG TPA: NapC/NirT family cytochrome c, partial [Dermatophilaceae bacterium]|nr:NapC/NirT family cytochrome c [Dermatophilaceae bacterium]